MSRRRNVSRAIVNAVTGNQLEKRSTLSNIQEFFDILNVRLACYRPEIFQKLREETLAIDEDVYRDSFKTAEDLQPAGDLGLSGSTFFKTPDARYLIKSLDRKSEYGFFEDEMMEPYLSHVRQNPGSLLIRITDYLVAPRHALSTMLGIISSRHIIMEDIMSNHKSHNQEDLKWETYDLKPASYFYPERDLAGGYLASTSTKQRLIDTFNDQLRVTRTQKASLVDQLALDCDLLEKYNVVDYSLFLVRHPSDAVETGDTGSNDKIASNWRDGITSTDGKWKYRAVVLDFLLAKHKLHARTMTFLISTFDSLFHRGHMSITTDPTEYRHRFLTMVEQLFEVTGD